ncbi:hypothetical protein, variant 1 [Aphanomyces astaci]|uniref:ACB domain-containing protein n=1 Tax=Aphanomyces astaci TaxID=112090 RepID=W4GS10_APHAT|nr:hypothetical protein, variant 1 [Aphanomyces astaci]ETV82520.1 hypothetical protein, variant 1 [Aphanomyces astaci]|eukprot:XP_009828189.1 hypothetical protein, variant 1 [Aphanomyces astaci]
MQGASVESDFAAAVLFLQTYNGPHRILRNPTSSVRLDFNALYQQATLGSCSAIAPPLDGSSSADLNSWAKWKALGHLSKEAAMQTYIKTMDDLVDNWRRSPSFRQPSGTLMLPQGGGSTSPSVPQTLIERLPSLVQEVADLKAKLHFDSQRHDELTGSLRTLSYDMKSTFTRELRQVDVLRTEMRDSVTRLDKQLQLHQADVTACVAANTALLHRVNSSVAFRAERAGWVVWQRLVTWTGYYRVTYIGGALAVVLLVVWRNLLKRKLPRPVADALIAAISYLARRPKTQPP